MILAMGVRFPRRVVGRGRALPRVRRPRRARRGDRGCRLRRRLPGSDLGHDVQRRPASASSSGATPRRSSSSRSPRRVSRSSRRSLQGPARPLRAPTRARAATVQRPSSPARTPGRFWDHFLECIRSRNPETLCPAELGYAAIATVNLGVQSYREGKAYLLRQGDRQVIRRRPRLGGRWEERSQLRGKPNQVIGWKAGDTGSLLDPPGLPEARRRLGRRQGPRRIGLTLS